MLVENASLGDAVKHGRFHHQFAPDVLFVEPSLRAEVLRELLARGHALRAYRGDETGRVLAIEVRGGMLRGAVDARGE
jgi:gamma-glutamyltranspeptidase